MRAAGFIDGFNVYHFIDNSENALSGLKWLDYRTLCERFLPTSHELTSVQYFTSVAAWDEDKARRHSLYIRALQTRNVQVLKGNFKKAKKKVIIRNEASMILVDTRDGRIAGTTFYGYLREEKQTDVNLAVQMVTKAALDEYDCAILVSGDTDFEPAIETVQRVFGKRVIVAVPNRTIAGSIPRIVGEANCRQITRADLANSQLPEIITDSKGRKLSRPQGWSP